MCLGHLVKMTDDDVDNNIVVTGALFALLVRAGDPLTAVGLPGDAASNQIDVRLSFMKSAYRITVERIPDFGDVDD